MSPPSPNPVQPTAEVREPAARAIVFGGEAAQIVGFYHPASVGAGGHIGAVLCSAAGYEAMCAHRAYRRLAERLAAGGVHALRFDYHGTGDSSGDTDEPERLRAWLASIDAAIDELRALSGVRSVILVGLRLGAALAVLAAEQRTDVDGLVLWAPCISGRAYVRELRVFRALAEHDAGLSQQPAGPRPGSTAGDVFGPDTLAALSSLDMLGLTFAGVGRALVLPRDDLPGAEPALVARLLACGVDAQLGGPSGYSRMMRDAQDTVVPEDSLAAIARWVCVPSALPPRDAGPAPEGSHILTAWTHGARREVHEEAFRFGPSSRLFGVLSEPASTRVHPGRPAIVYLNVGANHHVGPNRMYVSLARRLAGEGYLGFRMDVAGLGESSLGHGGPQEALYANASLDDIAHALTFLSERRGVTRFVLVGLCSGAYLAYHGAARDARVVGQVLVNPQTFEWKAGDSLVMQRRQSYKSTRYYLAALADRRVWRQALRGELDQRGVAVVLGKRLWARTVALSSRLGARLFGRGAPRSAVERRFFELSDRGVESLLVFSATDGGLDMIERHLGSAALRARGPGHLRVEVVEGADHTFTLASARDELEARVTDFIARAFP
jgi:dienelactone hydrolase